jgi:aldehyde dehydrogenase (NAD+)
MQEYHRFYINGAWTTPQGARNLFVEDPSYEEAFASIKLGNEQDVDAAVAAAAAAFTSYSLTEKAERIELLERIVTAYEKRAPDLAQAVSREMGAPREMALNNQVASGAAHLYQMIQTLERFEFDRANGATLITKEPVGVVAMITPWNWPLNQITCKVAPALAAGCTMVLKPSELAPVSAIIFTEIMHEAKVPAGVFNLVNGDGPTVGEALARHPLIDMVSITGSTRAGVLVAKAAADTVKRVHQELGGKSANIILEDADFETAVGQGVKECFDNTGQSCNAPTRMLVPTTRMAEALEIARKTAGAFRTGPADQAGVDLGPVVSQTQFGKIQTLIQAGLDEGAVLVAGGIGRPDGLERGYFVKPTIFGNVTSDMTIAREEIFGPVLCIIGYETDVDAIRIANDSPYGLAAYVQSGNLQTARELARKLRVGTVHINYPDWDTGAPFGGFKQSGNGREYAEFGLEDFLEVKGIVGYNSAVP